MHAATIDTEEADLAHSGGSDLQSANAAWREPPATGPREAASTSADEALMGAYRDGNADAFRVLYLRYRDKLHRYLLRLAAGAEEAEEVFQEVWISVIRSSHRYEPRAPFAAWLFTIAHRCAATRWRELERRHAETITPVDDVDVTLDALPQFVHTPERDAGNDALGKALIDAIRRLPLPQREAFLMRAEGGLGPDEIAAATGVSRETAKSRLRYAQNRLRAALEDWR